MTKYYCDECGKELEQTHTGSGQKTVVLSKGKARWSFTIMRHLNGVSNSGHLCPACETSLVSKAIADHNGIKEEPHA
jgi:hypothetical protein